MIAITPRAGERRWPSRLISLTPALLWMAVIFWLSSRRSLPTGGVEVVSVLGHFTVYAVLTVLLYGGLRREGLAVRRAMLLALVLATLYGVTDEVHQSFVPGRDPDPLDLIVDAIGAGTALTLIALRRVKHEGS